jgi:hypothetical protein
MRASVAVLATLAVLASGGLPASATAATYLVGTPSDVTGTCGSPASGPCSLRQLIEYENHLAVTPTPPDTIALPGGKYELTHGELVITQSLAINGAGARTTHVARGGDTSPARVFKVIVPTGGTAPKVGISGLEISGGTAGESNGFFGGDVYNAGDLVLEEDWITAGTASSGGGVSNDTGTLLLQRSLVSGNHASTGGADSGGIQNHGSAAGKKGVLKIEDSTIAGNDARLGGGVFSWSDAADGNEVLIVNSTIANNTTQNESSGEARGPGAGLLASDGKIEAVGSIVAFNNEIAGGTFVKTNCSTSGSATIVSGGYNLESESDCGFKSIGDLQFMFPAFSSSAPQDNGGNTDTLALMPTSPAVDAIPTSFPACGGLDQRDVARPQGAGCDIGAVELVPFMIGPTEEHVFSGKLTTVEFGVSGTPTIHWGDGHESKATVHESEIDGSHTYAEEGTYNGSVTYADDSGTHQFPFQANVADGSLGATGEPLSGTAGVPLSSVVASFTDGDPGGVASDYTASIDWGDGSSTTGAISSAGKSFAVTGSHTYASAGVYKTAVTVSDIGGAKAIGDGSVNVERAPTLELAQPAAATLVGSPTSITATVMEDGAAQPGKLVTFTVTGANPQFGSAATNAAGQAIFTYAGTNPGTDHIVASFLDKSGKTVVSNEVTRTWTAPSPPPSPPKSEVLPSKVELPAPTLGKTVNIEVVSGLVFVKLPKGAHFSTVSALLNFPASPLTALASLSKGFGFVPLNEARQIPVGSTLDTTEGVARLTSATASVGKPQSGDFGAGIFTILQNRKQRGLVVLNIVNTQSPRKLCATIGKAKKAQAAARHLSSKVLGRLSGNAHGKYTTNGKYSAATVRGTIWSVANRCDGTLTQVSRGVVSVRDFALRKTITLHAGQRYLAKAP